MKYKTLILDFDGTIADTKESILQTMKFVADRFNFKDFDKKTIEHLIGLPLQVTLEKAFSIRKNMIEEATLAYRRHYDEIVIDTISLFDGVEETLLRLSQKGLTITIASSKGKEALNKILKKQNIDHVFSYVGGEEDVKNKKPSPEIVNLILDKYSCNPSECLVVGDTIFDIEMGQRANVDTCGVTYGNSTKEKLEKLKPNYLIDTFRMLTDIV